MSVKLELTVAGFAVWNSPQAHRPQPMLLPPNERRRAPDTVAVALTVAQAACANAGRDPAQLPTVFASTYGDLAITDYMCGTLAQTPNLLSPTRFHNSVHNAAAGYWSIATACRQPYCALGAGEYTFAAGLFAAALQVCADDTDVLFVAYDIDARGPLAQITHSRGMLGMALVLGAGQERNPSRLQLTLTAAAPAHAAAAANAMAACLPLIAALESRVEALLSLPLGPDSALEVRVRHA
ncbi:MAG TPA: beta-ketoacyl synthase chain length factor [Steroidobacteraceae bacterium]|nr:beta-ketoacyl synthase chain length factor [Steroidobacteraceae bacterium]